MRDLDWSDVLADADRMHDEDVEERGRHEGCDACGPIGPMTEQEAAEMEFWDRLHAMIEQVAAEARR